MSSRTSNALNALVLSERVRFKQTSETVCTDGRVPDEIRERVSSRLWGRQLKTPDAPISLNDRSVGVHSTTADCHNTMTPLSGTAATRYQHTPSTGRYPVVVWREIDSTSAARSSGIADRRITTRRIVCGGATAVEKLGDKGGV